MRKRSLVPWLLIPASIASAGLFGYAINHARNALEGGQPSHMMPIPEVQEAPKDEPIIIAANLSQYSQPQSTDNLVDTEIQPLEANRQDEILDRYVEAVIEIESNGNPNASRYESHIKDTSFGLGQILTKTAKDIEKRHPELPRLGDSFAEIKRNLCNPEINMAYTRALFKEELDFYGDPFTAVAAYNSGHLTPKRARIEEQLNDICGLQLKEDGIYSRQTIEAIKRLQRESGLEADGKIGAKTYNALQKVWKQKFPDEENPRAIIPINRYTPNHVRKFKAALEN